MGYCNIEYGRIILGGMKKKTHTGCGNSHFVTFRCAGRRVLLGEPPVRQIAMSVLSSLAERGRVEVSAFVIMPDHVHALVWYPAGDKEHSNVIQTWKRLSSHYILKHFDTHAQGLSENLERTRNGSNIRSVWNRRFYDRNVLDHDEARDIIDYIHHNPVKAGLVKRESDWIWGSAPWYNQRRDVGVRIKQGL